MRKLIESQCSCCSTGRVCFILLVKLTTRARAFCTRWSFAMFDACYIAQRWRSPYASWPACRLLFSPYRSSVTSGCAVMPECDSWLICRRFGHVSWSWGVIKYNPEDFNVVSQWNDSTGYVHHWQCDWWWWWWWCAVKKSTLLLTCHDW